MAKVGVNLCPTLNISRCRIPCTVRFGLIPVNPSSFGSVPFQPVRVHSVWVRSARVRLVRFEPIQFSHYSVSTILGKFGSCPFHLTWSLARASTSPFQQREESSGFPRRANLRGDSLQGSPPGPGPPTGYRPPSKHSTRGITAEQNDIVLWHIQETALYQIVTRLSWDCHNGWSAAVISQGIISKRFFMAPSISSSPNSKITPTVTILCNNYDTVRQSETSVYPTTHTHVLSGRKGRCARTKTFDLRPCCHHLSISISVADTYSASGMRYFVWLLSLRVLNTVVGPRLYWRSIRLSDYAQLKKNIYIYIISIHTFPHSYYQWSGV